MHSLSLSHNNILIQQIQQINSFEKDWKIKTNLNKFTITHLDNKLNPSIYIHNKKTEVKTEGNMLGLLIKKLDMLLIPPRGQATVKQKWKSYIGSGTCTNTTKVKSTRP